MGSDRATAPDRPPVQLGHEPTKRPATEFVLVARSDLRDLIDGAENVIRDVTFIRRMEALLDE